jgi:hypothetical protein
MVAMATRMSFNYSHKEYCIREILIMIKHEYEQASACTKEKAQKKKRCIKPQHIGMVTNYRN